MSNYPPDPGGVFASDVHRRVAAHLPVPGEDPTTVEALLIALQKDRYTPVGEDERVALEAVLEDLAGDGIAKELQAGWRLLKAGLDQLSGPALTDVALVGDEYVRQEPPPLEGPKLEEALTQTERIASEDAEIERQAKANAVVVAEEQLEVARAAAAEVEEGA